MDVPNIQQLLINLKDVSSADHNEVYVKYGAAPTRADYQFRYSNVAAANQQVLVPSAAPGTWYILVYGDTIPAPSTYTLTASTAGIYLFGVTPDHHGNGANAVLTLSGAGFTSSTTVDLVAANGTIYPITDLADDSPTQLTATIPANAVPAGTYTVEANQADGTKATLPNAFTMVQGGAAVLKTDIVAPRYLSRGSYSTIYVDVSNTGDIAMPAPLLIVTATQNGQPAPC